MSRGKNLVEMIRLSSEVPYENSVLIPDGKRIYRYDPETEWFTEQVVTGGDTVESEPVPVTDESLLPASGWVQVTDASRKLTVASLQVGLSRHSVALAAKKAAPSRVKVPRLPVSLQLRKQSPVEKKIAVAEPDVISLPSAEESESQVEPVHRDAEEIAREPQATTETESKSAAEAIHGAQEVKVTFLPTPKKRQRKVEESNNEEETPQQSRPLKVIRRRKQEEPKVFETPPKTFPTVLLEGVKSPTTESGE